MVIISASYNIPATNAKPQRSITSMFIFNPCNAVTNIIYIVLNTLSNLGRNVAGTIAERPLVYCSFRFELLSLFKYSTKHVWRCALWCFREPYFIREYLEM